MKLTKFLVLALAGMLAFSTNAQELKKAVLGIEGFTYSSSFTPADVEMVRNKVVNAIRRTGRVIVVDRQATSTLRSEAEHRKQESAMDANSVADMVTLNANSVLTANLDQLSITREIYEEKESYKDSNGKTQIRVKGRYPYIKAVITYTVKITDCETGTAQAQETYSIASGGYNSYNHTADYETIEAAHKGIMNASVNDDAFKILILNTFRAQGKVLQIDEGDAKKAKKVFVSLGSEDGIAKKQVLEVFKEIDIAGELSRKMIGEIEVEEVLSGSRCLCKVKKGGDVILQVLEAGGNLPVQTREVKQRGFLGLGGIN